MKDWKCEKNNPVDELQGRNTNSMNKKSIRYKHTKK